MDTLGLAREAWGNQSLPQALQGTLVISAVVKIRRLTGGLRKEMILRIRDYWRCSSEHGFTLIELLIVVAILEHRLLYYMLLDHNLNLPYLHLS